MTKYKLVFEYEFWYSNPNFRLVRAYKLLQETKSHVQVRHWYGRRWHPKSKFWRVEETA